MDTLVDSDSLLRSSVSFNIPKGSMWRLYIYLHPGMDIWRFLASPKHENNFSKLDEIIMFIAYRWCLQNNPEISHTKKKVIFKAGDTLPKPSSFLVSSRSFSGVYSFISCPLNAGKLRQTLQGTSPSHIPHLRVGYNPFTNHLLTSWDIQVSSSKLTWRLLENSRFQ